MSEVKRHHLTGKTAIALFLLGRYLFASFFLYGFWHKLIKGWLWSDVMERIFIKRLGELSIGSFQAGLLM